MRRLGATDRRTLLQQWSAAALIIFVITQAFGTTAVSGQTPAPDECEGVASRVVEIEGEVTQRSTLVDQFSTNIDLITIRTQTGIERIELDGKPELIEVGETYRFTAIPIERVLVNDEGQSAGTELVALLSSAFGDHLACLEDEEGEPLDLGVSIVDEDGEATPIEDPPLLPDAPISARTFFIGFGIFAFLIFLIRFR